MSLLSGPERREPTRREQSGGDFQPIALLPERILSLVLRVMVVPSCCSHSSRSQSPSDGSMRVSDSPRATPRVAPEPPHLLRSVR
jgi:hypothetical protein